jgi:hypothetical protein
MQKLYAFTHEGAMLHLGVVALGKKTIHIMLLFSYLSPSFLSNWGANV